MSHALERKFKGQEVAVKHDGHVLIAASKFSGQWEESYKEKYADLMA